VNEATGIRLLRLDGSTKDYPAGRSLTVDGYGDYQVHDEVGQIIATVRRSVVDEIEVLFGE
jgi:hypothetical protein